MSIFSIFGGKKSTKINYNINVNNGVQGDGPHAGGCNRGRRGRHHRGGFHGKRGGCGRKGPMGLMKLLKMAQSLSGGGFGGKNSFAAISSGPQGTTMLASSSGGGGFPGMAGLNLLS